MSMKIAKWVIAFVGVAGVIAACSSAGGTDSSGTSDEDTGTAGSAGSGKAGSSGAGASSGKGGSSGSAGNKPDGGGIIESGIPDGPNPDAFFANDPPPGMCDGGLPPVTPGGTVDCPDDKNREGCPCKNAGETAACWPGLRKNRNRGVCKDGMTTCQAKGEVSAAWGPCVGYVLPTEGATTGAAACKCFSGGQWKLENLSPCFVSNGTSTAGAVSTIVKPGTPPAIDCPPEASMSPLKAPSQPWSKNTLTVDCAGHFKLCYTLKAGSSMDPKPTDCVVAKVCTEGDYLQVNKAQPMPDLPAWVTTTPAQVTCADQFTKTGGYGEMSVEGLSVECDDVNKVFNRVQYCPLSCNTNPSAPECKNCMAGGGGSF